MGNTIGILDSKLADTYIPLQYSLQRELLYSVRSHKLSRDNKISRKYGRVPGTVERLQLLLVGYVLFDAIFLHAEAHSKLATETGFESQSKDRASTRTFKHRNSTSSS